MQRGGTAETANGLDTTIHVTPGLFLSGKISTLELLSSVPLCFFFF